MAIPENGDTLKDVVIVSGVRTPVGRFGGTLSSTPAVELGGLVIEEAVRRAGIGTKDVQEVLMGQVVQAGMGQNPARQAAIRASIPFEVGATTVNKVCGSGLKTVMMAANAIKAGEYDIMVAGGMENMDLAPFVLYKARTGYRLGDGKIVDAMVHDGLWDKYNDFHMGITGEIIAEKYGLTREEIDEFALRSHTLAAQAHEKGLFKDEILPVDVKVKRDTVTFDRDEGVRSDTTIEKLAKLRPAFKDDGVVTAGNASQISDGAAALVIMSADRAEEMGLTPLVTIRGYATSGMEPEHVMSAPVPAIRRQLELTGLIIEDMDLIEHNEAFASASVAVQREFGIPDDRFNVHGGAVAIGHPIGASGARVLVTMIYAMISRDVHRGMEAVCLGGGNAVTMVVER
jgi:acetyl-CoA C-acetyltransferase